MIKNKTIKGTIAAFSLIGASLTYGETLLQSSFEPRLNVESILHDMGYFDEQVNDITVKRVWDEVEQVYKLESLKVDFENSNDISTTNLNTINPGRDYETVVSVFGFKTVNLRIYVDDYQGFDQIFIDAQLPKGQPGYSNYEPNFSRLFGLDSRLKYAGPLKTADIETIKVLDKNLSFRLYQHEARSTPDQHQPEVNGFKIMLNWLGMGEREYIVKIDDHGINNKKAKAVALIIEDMESPIPGGQLTGKRLSVEYEMDDFRQVSPSIDIDSILYQLYPNVPPQI